MWPFLPKIKGGLVNDLLVQISAALELGLGATMPY